MSTRTRSLFSAEPVDLSPHPLAPKPVAFEPRQGPCLKRIAIDDPMHTDNVNRALLEGACLDEGQMFALMNMSGDHRHQAIWHYARQNIFEFAPFTFGTFAEMAERGYAEKPEGSKYHRLTAQAGPLANAVADELVKRHAIHAPTVLHARAEKTKFATFRCTCGWTCAISNWKLQANASRAYTSHLRSINTLANIADSIAESTRRQGGEG